MENLSQTSAPVYEALERFRKKRVVPYKSGSRGMVT